MRRAFEVVILVSIAGALITLILSSDTRGVPVAAYCVAAAVLLTLIAVALAELTVRRLR